jgi:hypothetical protein
VASIEDPKWVMNERRELSFIVLLSTCFNSARNDCACDAMAGPQAYRTVLFSHFVSCAAQTHASTAITVTITKHFGFLIIIGGF